MTKFFLVLSFFFAMTSLTYAQSVNGVPLPALQVEFIKIIESNSPEQDNPSVLFEIEDPLLDSPDAIEITDRSDMVIRFDNGMEAVNYWSKYYQLEWAYAVYNPIADAMENHYILKRKGR